MPYVIRPKQLRMIAVALFGAVMLIGGVPAVASAKQACASTETSKAFQSYGDNSEYSLLSGSTFSSGAPGWSLVNSLVGSEGLGSGSGALAIEPSGTALSPQFCINQEEPTFRFFARQRGGGGFASLSVTIVWQDAVGIRHATSVGTVDPSSKWGPTQTLPLSTRLPLWMPGSTLMAQLQFRAEGGGSYAIANVYIDPHSR
jgi:hypothetical protein